MRQAAMVIDNGALTKEPLGYSPTPCFHGEQLLSEMADMMLLLLNFFLSLSKTCLGGNDF